MLVKIEARILIFPGTDFHLPSTSVPPGTFLKALLTPTQRVPRRTTAGSNVGDCLVFFRTASFLARSAETGLLLSDVNRSVKHVTFNVRKFTKLQEY